MVLVAAGGLIGLDEESVVSNAYATGKVKVSGVVANSIEREKENDTASIASVFAGGLIGTTTGTNQNVYASGEVSVTDVDAKLDPNHSTADLKVWGQAYVGGLLGSLDTTTSLDNAYATGNVTIDNITSDIDSYILAGGLIGVTFNGGVKNTYASNNVTISGLDITAPVAGGGSSWVTEESGGLIGRKLSNVINSYFDTDAYGNNNGTGTGNATGITGKTSTELKTASTFSSSGWDFVNTWAPAGDGYYPELYSLTPVLHVKILDQSRSYGSDKPVELEYLGGHRQYAFGSNDALLPLSTSIIHTVATDRSNVGVYDIDVLGDGDDWNAINYRIIRATNTAKLTIKPADVTVTVNNDSKFRDPIPYSGGNGVSYEGLLFGQSSSVFGGSLVYSGSAQGALSPGDYALRASGLTAQNYNISYVGGILTIYGGQSTSSVRSSPPPTISSLASTPDSIRQNSQTYRHTYVSEANTADSETLQNLLLTNKACFSAGGWSSCGEIN
jgi:hypothetical protein